ncbi:hypothetical protein [Neobacillus dielmonensis]|uniref:hypothetical protein n=1 Tax=Neobacillus dielmonensis TaxID=1347369 RepID=UPI0006947D0B|nr:hypothetical protein [Neobacillus dielmonensis]
MDIYHAIWEADQKGSGLLPITAAEIGDPNQGYVVVDLEACSPDHQVFKEVEIPDRKRHSYKLVERLFDNYTLSHYSREKNSSNESKEVKEFLQMAIDSPPVKLAKNYIEEKNKKCFTEMQWYTHLHDLWFRQYDCESGKDLSGFEHVFVGEQRKRRLEGHHFWYKYWLEDQSDLNNHHPDQIELKCEYFGEQKGAPFVVTFGYRLQAFDYQKRRFFRVGKNHCAFLVGISAEGLLALGTVRALKHKDVPEEIVINDATFKLELFMSPDGKSIRTFYPIDPESERPDSL